MGSLWKVQRQQRHKDHEAQAGREPLVHGLAYGSHQPNSTEEIQALSPACQQKFSGKSTPAPSSRDTAATTGVAVFVLLLSCGQGAEFRPINMTTEVTKGELKERGPDRLPAQLPEEGEEPWAVLPGGRHSESPPTARPARLLQLGQAGEAGGQERRGPTEHWLPAVSSPRGLGAPGIARLPRPPAQRGTGQVAVTVSLLHVTSSARRSYGSRVGLFRKDVRAPLHPPGAPSPPRGAAPVSAARERGCRLASPTRRLRSSGRPGRPSSLCPGVPGGVHSSRRQGRRQVVRKKQDDAGLDESYQVGGPEGYHELSDISSLSLDPEDKILNNGKCNLAGPSPSSDEPQPVTPSGPVRGSPLPPVVPGSPGPPGPKHTARPFWNLPWSLGWTTAGFRMPSKGLAPPCGAQGSGAAALGAQAGPQPLLSEPLDPARPGPARAPVGSDSTTHDSA
ncbi:PREDICTED: collagen alpha-1(X) chain-like [Lipotes vexillifer]|uniref:Collagen alpha-1(X) chain-like n=1 Tax=Lipotes vexillifer TaxID=118797 RepID=A0A340XYI6_LIPVE|nr:PREDICTED: collagen alpha-1(X) chain-like [Lipotes vexillifer]